MTYLKSCAVAATVIALSACALDSADAPAAPETQAAGAKADTVADELSRQLMQVACVEHASPERTITLVGGEGGGEQTGNVLVVVRDGVDANACADDIRASDPNLQILGVLDRLGIINVRRVPTPAERLATQLGAVACVQNATPETTIYLDGSGGEQTGTVIVTVREGIDANDCAEDIRLSDASLEITNVLDVLGIVGVRVAPMPAERLAEDLRNAASCVEHASPERTISLAGSEGSGGGGQQTGRAIVTVRDGVSATACADEIIASDPSFDVVDVLDRLGILLVARR